MQQPLSTKWGSFNDLTALDKVEDEPLWCQDLKKNPIKPNTNGSPSSSSPFTIRRGSIQSPKPHKPLSRTGFQQQQPGVQYENRHRPLSRLSQLQHECSTSASAVGRYSLSPPRLFPPAELPPVGRLRRVFTAHARRRKKHTHGFQLTNLMKEPLRVVHSVPLCFPEG
ncbi:hypothetical protein SK128_022833, partial [Halocaridina rubra]